MIATRQTGTFVRAKIFNNHKIQKANFFDSQVWKSLVKLIGPGNAKAKTKVIINRKSTYDAKFVLKIFAIGLSNIYVYDTATTK